MIYLLIANVSLLVCYGLYTFIFKKLTFFGWNRFYLLGAVLFSLTVPIGLFIELPNTQIVAHALPTVNLEEFINIALGEQEEAPVRLLDILRPLYWVGVGIAMFLLLYRIFLLQRRLRSADGRDSFSFFNQIVIGKHVKQNVVRIEQHERVHVEQGHSYDLLFFELVRVFNWFNPILYCYQKELKFQHECIADEVCSADKVAYAEMLVAHAMKVDHLGLAHEFSDHSFLKKRIQMLFKSKSAEKHRFLYMSVLPAFLLIGSSTLIFNTSGAKEIVANVEGKINVEVERDVADRLPSLLNPAGVENKRTDTVRVSPLAKTDTTEIGNELFTAVEENPEPVGGMRKFMEWIGANYRYPQAAIDARVNGLLEISFIVQKDGKLSDFVVKKDMGYGTGEAAVELFKKAEPWKPGVQNGRPVRVQYTCPIRISTVVNAKPEMGMVALREWFSNNFKKPRSISSNDFDPVIGLVFDVDKNGLMSNIRVDSELEDAFKQEAVRLLKQTKWQGTVNGEKVASRGVFYIKFGSDGRFISDYTRVDVNPEPIGGMTAYRNGIVSTLDSKRIDKTGDIKIGFVVAENGEPIDFEVLQEPVKGVGEEVVRLIKDKKKWKPGILDGKPIAYRYELTLGLEKESIAGELNPIVKWKGLKSGKVR